MSDSSRPTEVDRPTENEAMDNKSHVDKETTNSPVIKDSTKTDTTTEGLNLGTFNRQDNLIQATGNHL